MARFRLELGPVPLHHQVYLDLRAALHNGEWRPGDLLPPERQLAGRYGCSLITVRRALSELTREGRIQRTRGRGTTVLPQRIERDIAGTMSFTEEMADRGLDPETRLIAARPESAGEVVAAALGIEPGSLYDVLTARYGTRIARAREALEPVLLRTREARLLGQKPRSPALLIEGITYGADGAPVEFARSYVRGDRTRYYVERVVVRASWHADPQLAVDTPRQLTGVGGGGPARNVAEPVAESINETRTTAPAG
jgi:GntR family transcriptional regulator